MKKVSMDATFTQYTLSLLLGFLFSQNLIAAPKILKQKSVQKITTEQILNSRKIRFTHFEKKLNHQIEVFYDHFTKGIVHKKLLNQIIRDSKSKTYLKPLRYWFKDIQYMTTSKNVDRIIKHCENLKYEKYEYDTLGYYIENYCGQKVSELIESKKNSLGKPNVFLYVTKNLNLFIHKNLNHFKKALESIHEDDLKKISHHITEYHISNDLYVNESLVKALHLTPRLTRYIQNKGFKSKYIQNTFYKDFYKQSSELFKLADKEASSRKLKEKIYQIINYIELNRNNLPMNKVEDRVISVGKSLSRRKKYYEARLFFSVCLQSEDSYTVEETHFENLWTYIENKKKYLAYKYIIDNNLTKNFKRLRNSKLKFWVANTIQMKNTSLSIPYYKDIILKDPVSYYGVASANEIASIENIDAQTLYRTIHAKKDDKNLIPKKLVQSLVYDSLKKIQLFGGLQSPSLIKEEIRKLKQKEEIAPKATTLLVSKTLIKAKKYLDSFKIVYRELNNDNFVFELDILHALFPKPYYKYVKKYSKSFDPLITLSLIRQESGFNPKARSHVGARGLMQLMPTTARQFRRVRAKSLEKPLLNLSIGTRYLKNLISRYDNNLILALASYNAGEGNVDEWIEDAYLHGENSLKTIEQYSI
jgi:soluble lytic murein transglycosylase